MPGAHGKARVGNVIAWKPQPSSVRVVPWVRQPSTHPKWISSQQQQESRSEPTLTALAALTSSWVYFVPKES